MNVLIEISEDLQKKLCQLIFLSHSSVFARTWPAQRSTFEGLYQSCFRVRDYYFGNGQEGGNSLQIGLGMLNNAKDECISF